MDVKETVKTFLQQRVGEDTPIAFDDDIFGKGLVNSLFALELVTFLEDTFAITVENEDLNLENFSRINAIDTFVRAKKEAAGAGA